MENSINRGSGISTRYGTVDNPVYKCVKPVGNYIKYCLVRDLYLTTGGVSS